MEKNDNNNNNDDDDDDDDSNNSDNNNNYDNYDNNKKLQKLASKLEVALKLPSVIRTGLVKKRDEIWFSFFFK